MAAHMSAEYEMKMQRFPEQRYPLFVDEFAFPLGSQALSGGYSIRTLSRESLLTFHHCMAAKAR